MRFLIATVILLVMLTPAWAQDSTDGPTNEKAQKTYKDAQKSLHDREILSAYGSFKKADKQDDGHCLACQKKIIQYGADLGEWKDVENAAEEMIAEAKTDREIALAHYQMAVVYVNEAVEKRKDEYYPRTHDEAAKALAAVANFPAADLLDGRALAHMRQDDAAKARFQQYLALNTDDDPERQRVLRYIKDPELARARMAPAFAVTTLDGQRISLDDLQGKVVLIDFWATWCGPCREALPHLRDVARKFQGQPLVVLSISLDSDEAKWKEFIAKNDMTWLQYRDPESFKGPIPKLFNVQAIPHTFTIDADGVLQDEHIGDASIEGKLKKLIANARDLQSAQAQKSASSPAAAQSQ